VRRFSWFQVARIRTREGKDLEHRHRNARETGKQGQKEHKPRTLLDPPKTDKPGLVTKEMKGNPTWWGHATNGHLGGLALREGEEGDAKKHRRRKGKMGQGELGVEKHLASRYRRLNSGPELGTGKTQEKKKSGVCRLRGIPLLPCRKGEQKSGEGERKGGRLWAFMLGGLGGCDANGASARGRWLRFRNR